MVHKGLADIVDLNATDMFLAGLDYNLVPFMAENYKGYEVTTQTNLSSQAPVAVLRKPR